MRGKRPEIIDREIGEKGLSYRADNARGEIILRTRRRRLIFIGGLVAWGFIAILALFAR